MLEQILEQMHIDADLLEELSEDQKQILFYKMRQEQVRRWKSHEEKMEEEDRRKARIAPNPGKKKVEFLKGKDGCEWVWVMGEHPKDKSIEQILEDEAHSVAQKQAEAEAKALREKEEAELHRKMEEEKKRIIRENERREAELKRKQEEAALYQSIKEARQAAEKLEREKKRLEEEEKKRLAEIELSLKVLQDNKETDPSDTTKSSPILSSPFLSEQEKKAKRRSREMAESMQEKRSSEIYSTLQKKRQTLVKLAEEGQNEVESEWKEQEKKAKEADKQIREMARQARAEYKESVRRSVLMMKTAQAFVDEKQSNNRTRPPLPPKNHLVQSSAPPGITSKKPRPLRPKNRDMVVSWFQKEEKIKGSGLDPSTGRVATWFHGIINRSETERLLEDKDCGTFLVRVSERVWGYTLSYKQANRFKHFLIDASDLGYQFFGADQAIHDTLAGLIDFHKDNPITISGGEKLLYPCGQSGNPPDYEELFQEKNKESSVTSL